MEDIFHKYYLSEEKILEMLRSALIVFDTSALLDLYYYSDAAQHNILTTVFNYLENRIWIPAQIQFEFLKNKDKVANKPTESYHALLKKAKSGDGGHVQRICELAENFGANDLKQICGQYQTLLEKTSSNDKHPYLSPEICNELEQAIQTVKQHIQEFQATVTSFSQHFESAVENQITQLSNRADNIQKHMSEKFLVGPELSYECMMEIAKEGSYRYQEKIPPGYEDSTRKIGLQKYGDLFIWKEILQYATQTQQNILLITNDAKDDWLDKDMDAPRFELLKEFYSVTSHHFWSCTMEKFLYLINQVLDAQQQIPDEVLQEVNTLQEQRSLGSFNTTEDSYEELLQNWMYQWTDVQIIDTILIRPEWKFGRNIRIYEGLDSEGWRCVVFLSILRGEIRYEKVLRAMRDPFVVKETFEEEGLIYRYYQFTLVDSSSAVKALFTQLDRPNPRKWFRNTDVQCNIGYINKDGDLFVADGNHPMG